MKKYENKMKALAISYLGLILTLLYVLLFR
jgi:hypothetical protein